MACASLFPSVSPDNQRVAHLKNGFLKVQDMGSQAILAEWRVPFGTWAGPEWFPTSLELCLGAGSSVGDRTGLWIYPLDSNEPVKVLTGQIMVASRAPDGTKLVFALRPPYFELWTADLDPALSTAEALGQVEAQARERIAIERARFPEAEGHLSRAEALFRENRNRREHAETLLELCALRIETGATTQVDASGVTLKGKKT